MAIYCGVDFHARQQTITYCETSGGEIKHHHLDHQQDDVRAFYAQFNGEVIVAFEASGYSQWFEDLLADLGHQAWVGNAREISRRKRSRQKNDRRDADLIFDLMIKNEFPRIFRLSKESREILSLLRYRHRLVKIRTMVRNSLHAIALTGGLSLKAKLLTKAGRERFNQLSLSPAHDLQRREWLELVNQLNQRVTRVEQELERRAQGDQRVALLRTHPGIGPLTSLALVHTLEPVSRFSSGRKVTAYAGMEPVERSSAERQRWGGISKAGSPLIRFLLIEAAHATIKQEAHLRCFYYRLVERRGSQKALVAVARKLLIRAYILLRDRIDYAQFQRRAVAVRSARILHRP